MSPMTPTPEPAVGQVWMNWDDTPFHIKRIDHHGPDRQVLLYDLEDDDARCVMPEYELNGATYLGTLDELRELPALKRDAELWRTQVRTDNTKVIERLERENAELRAALKELASFAGDISKGDNARVFSHLWQMAGRASDLASNPLTPTPHE